MSAPAGIRVSELDTSVGFSMWEPLCALHGSLVPRIDQHEAIEGAIQHAARMHGTEILDLEVWFIDREPVR